jgi:Ras family protein A
VRSHSLIELTGHTAHSISQVYVPTVFENYVADVEVDGKHVELGIPPARKTTIVSGPSAILIPTSFLFVSRSTLQTPLITYRRRWVTTFLAPDLDLTEWIWVLQWISEVMHFCAGLPVILVGCKKDLRRDQRTIEELRKTSQRPVTLEEVSLSYCLCSGRPLLMHAF